MLLDATTRRDTSTEFVLPNPDRLALIREGWVVKVESNGERFWVHVLFMQGNSILGRVDNELIHPTNRVRWPYGGAIELSHRHILDAQGPADRDAFRIAGEGKVEHDLVIQVVSERNQPCAGGEELFQRYMAHRPSSQ